VTVSTRRTLHHARRAAATLALCALAGTLTATGATAAPLASAPTTASGATTPGAAASDAARSCPSAPPRPPTSTHYKLDGENWDPAEPIDWVLDTRNVAAGAVAGREADIRRALADAARPTHFDFVDKGTETRVRTSPPYLLVQFAYVRTFPTGTSGDLGNETTTFVNGARTQSVDATVSLAATLAPGFGSYDLTSPTASPEGDVLLHEIGAVLGLRDVTTPDPGVVMQPEAGPGAYYGSYQTGDVYGLWRVGAADGCRNFPV
jgi:hypothetical protein